MAYATVDELAAALRVTVTPANTTLLTECLEAAAEEIDGFLDRLPAVQPLETVVPASIQRANVNRAVEWYKAADAANGQVGSDAVGVLTPPPGDGFARHGLTIRRFKEQWGLA